TIIFVVVFVVEAALIILGNAFTIFVFSAPTRTSHIRITCYLLINLAFADLFLGITEPIILGTKKGKRENALPGVWIPGAMQLFSSSASMFFLALISLERAFAVLKPLRHRVVSTRVYIYSIVVVWTVGIFILGLMALSFYYPKLERETVDIVAHFCLFISLLVICASYLKIRTRLSSTAPEVAAVKSRQTTEHNARLSRTLFAVIALSLLFWLPAFAVYIGRDFCQTCFYPYVMWTVNVFHLANSLVNPFVHSFRMPVFKEALEKLSRRRRHVIGTRNIEATSLALNVAIIFVVVFVVEAALIILGNAFTIFVFLTPTRTSHIRRTCYLLINLAVADLLVGITEPIILGMEKGINETNPLRGKRENGLPGAMQLFASSASVFFLALISLERAFAVLKPLRHRVVSTCVYIYSIVVVWAVGILILGLMALSFYYPKLARETVHVVVHFCLFISFVMICASYLKIRTRLSSTAPEVAVVNGRQTTEYNVRLSRTLFVVIALSLLFWLPAFAVYIGRDICKRCFHPYVVWTVNVFHLANSLVNPFVYSFRMPAFKEALEKLSRRRRHVIGTRN
ncbi:unnamed protein product, partial [Porites lobata]